MSKGRHAIKSQPLASRVADAETMTMLGQEKLSPSFSLPFRGNLGTLDLSVLPSPKTGGVLCFQHPHAKLRKLSDSPTVGENGPTGHAGPSLPSCLSQ